MDGMILVHVVAEGSTKNAVERTNTVAADALIKRATKHYTVVIANR